MARLTITLSDERHKALREVAARQGTTMDAVIEESLDRAGVRTESPLEILERAWAHAAAAKPPLDEDQVQQLAIEETHAFRREAGRKPLEGDG